MLIFCQYDPRKNPLQLLGKTSLKALLYFWKMLLQRSEIYRKIPTNTITDLSHFLCLSPPRKMCQISKTVKTEIYYSNEQPRNSCPELSCTFVRTVRKSTTILPPRKPCMMSQKPCLNSVVPSPQFL